MWAFATAHTVVYAIQEGRGFHDAAAVLGAEFDGVLVRDGWAPYRQFAQAAHVSGTSDPVLSGISNAHPRALWPPEVQTVLQEALAVRDRVIAGIPL